MRLATPVDLPAGAIRRTFRYGVLSHAFAFCAFVVVPTGVFALVGRGLLELSLGWKLVAGPFAFLVGGLWLLVALAVGSALLGTLGPGGWVMKVAGDGLWLKLRSYQNHHFVGAPPLVHLSFGEIESAGRVTELAHEGHGDERVRTMTSWLELRLRGVDTEPLRAAVAEERAHEGPERRFLGIRHRGRSQHVPVTVPAPGVVRVDWRGRGMLRALEGRVAVVPPRRFERGQADDPTSAEDRVLELALRGERLKAIFAARRELGLSTTAAKELVDGLLGAPEPGAPAPDAPAAATRTG